MIRHGNGLILCEIQIDQTSCAVIEDHVKHHQGFFVRAVVRRSAESYANLFLPWVLQSYARHLAKGLPATGQLPEVVWLPNRQILH